MVGYCVVGVVVSARELPSCYFYHSCRFHNVETSRNFHTLCDWPHSDETDEHYTEPVPSQSTKLQKLPFKEKTKLFLYQ